MHNDEMHGAQVVNISASGARLTGLGPLASEALVIICYLHHRVRGRVVWSNEKQTAVRFASPLPMADVQALRGAAGRSLGSWGAGERQPTLGFESSADKGTTRKLFLRVRGLWERDGLRRTFSREEVSPTRAALV